MKKTLIWKIKFLVNNQQKKIAFFVVLFFAFIALDDLNVLFLKIPDFDQLIVSEGKLRINQTQSRIRSIFTLVINNQKIPFNCGGDTACVPIENIEDYQGKSGKAWWFQSKGISRLDGGTRLYQLEVNGKLVFDYQKQVEHYLSMKNEYFYQNIMFLILSLIVFFLLQFANNPTSSKGSEK